MFESLPAANLPIPVLAVICAAVVIGLLVVLRPRAKKKPRHRFKDMAFNRTGRYALGLDTQTGGYYLSIPVTIGVADYEEYYAISEAEFETFRSNPNAATTFADACRRREMDHLLIVQPGRNRGDAS